MCKEWHMQKFVSVDHIIPTGSLRCAADAPGFIERMFVGVDDYQVLCDTCHLVKTNKEREERKNDR